MVEDCGTCTCSCHSPLYMSTKAADIDYDEACKDSAHDVSMIKAEAYFLHRQKFAMAEIIRTETVLALENILAKTYIVMDIKLLAPLPNEILLGLFHKLCHPAISCFSSSDFVHYYRWCTLALCH